MKSENREIVIGAATFAALALVLGLSYGSEQDWAPKPDADSIITAKFNRVDGLVIGDDVRMGGIKIGVVDKMTLDKEYRAIVSMRLDYGAKLPLDTSVAIHTDGLFGSKFMVLEPGAEEEFLKSGEEITYTQGAVIVSDLLDLIISEGRAAMKKRQDKKVN
ncbi:MAG: MCE family protein [Alphaproteobacteria bacterium]|jgi:phospholipid/cholesterol/gamma-HCH transport system substrate-binding protein|nr:MCE family protein [Alphaproteobacteria bacterium]MBT7943841.1 MCE family protein [Alphaproteobacteria bacterium]